MPVFDSVGHPTLLVALGAVGVLVALTLLQLLRRIRRMVFTAAVLAAVSGAGVGGGWAVLDGLKVWH